MCRALSCGKEYVDSVQSKQNNEPFHRRIYMVLQSVLFQLVIPLLLLVTLPIAANSMISITLRALIVLGYLMLARWVSLWLYFPWYFFYVYLFVLFALYSRYFFPFRIRPLFPGKEDRFIFPVEASLAFLLLAMNLYVFMGRQPLGTYIVDLESPIRDNNLYVMHGGSIPMINAHMGQLVGLSVQSPGNIYGLDLVVLNDEGRASNDIRPGSNEIFPGFNAAVSAPCNGTVMRVNRDYSDQALNERTSQVLLSCSNYEVLLGHLLNNTIVLEPGATVEAGQFIGRLGSLETGALPFLHMHAQRRLAGDDGAIIEPVQISIGGSFVARGAIIPGDSVSSPLEFIQE